MAIAPRGLCLESVAPSSLDGDEPVKSSGPRIRPSPDFGRGPALPNRMGHAERLVALDKVATSPTAPALSLGLLRLDQQISARTLLPWVVIAGLLIVVGLLTGIVLVREPSSSAVAPNAVATAAAQPASAATLAAVVSAAATAASPEPEAEPTAIAPPVVARPAPSLSTASPQQPVRWVPRAPAPMYTRSAVAPAGASPSGRHDCSPPFYFEGNKKIFKTNCL